MRRIESCWQSPARFLLLPFGLIYALLSRIRRLSYRYGLLKSARLPVPVVIVGNITAGGSGKTPLVAALAAGLSSKGFHPGIVSRGYGGSATRPLRVDENSNPEIVGDEPVLLKHRGFPVWIGRRRVEAALKLLEANTECDILIADDGLQHYALCRDFEIIVIDASKGFGNGLPLPSGPLREPLSRLKSANAVVVNSTGEEFHPEHELPTFTMKLTGERFFSVDHPEISAKTADFTGKRIHAIAGIGNPSRFFGHLSRLGMQFESHPFPDHHFYRKEDLEFEDCDIILMTEKDAVKCRGFAQGKCWYLPVDAEIDTALVELILETLGKTDGP